MTDASTALTGSASSPARSEAVGGLVGAGKRQADADATGRKSVYARAKASKSTVWREVGQVQGRCRRRYYASRGGYSLFVLVIRVDDDLSRVWARLDDPKLDSVDVSGINSHDVPRHALSAQVLVAKRLCEMEADRLAGAR